MRRKITTKNRGLQTVKRNARRWRDSFTGHQIRIGVMGSSGGDVEPNVAALSRSLGRAIAKHGCCLLTGACPGLPHEAVLGAWELDGRVVGISPAASLREHIETFDSPFREYGVLIFTGLGLMGRELVNIRSSDIVIVVGGRSGTLGEFAIAYETGKLIGVLTGTGGITGALGELQASLNKNTGSEILYDSDSEQLVVRLLERYRDHIYVCPTHPASQSGPPGWNEDRGSRAGRQDGRPRGNGIRTG
jgi:uncharacterized protein (TIGR00725 family)